MNFESVLRPESRDTILKFYETYEPNYVYFDRFKTLPPFAVKNLFYGDSITAGFPLHDLFPGRSIINRALPGDTPTGLYLRLEQDLFAFTPQRVFMMCGINGIECGVKQVFAELSAVAGMIQERGSEVYLCSILPIRYPDKYNRFQYQEDICQVNAALRDHAAKNGMGYLDYHAAVRDEKGELAAEYARPDGTHITAAGYLRMSRVVAPYLL